MLHAGKYPVLDIYIYIDIFPNIFLHFEFLVPYPYECHIMLIQSHECEVSG